MLHGMVGTRRSGAQGVRWVNPVERDLSSINVGMHILFSLISSFESWIKPNNFHKIVLFFLTSCTVLSPVGTSQALYRWPWGPVLYRRGKLIIVQPLVVAAPYRLSGYNSRGYVREDAMPPRDRLQQTNFWKPELNNCQKAKCLVLLAYSAWVRPDSSSPSDGPKRF